MRRTIVTGVAVLAVVGPAVALACMNAVELDTKQAKQLVAKAERALEAGTPRKALRLLEDEIEVADAALQKRVDLLRAVAQARTGYGTLALGTLKPMLQARPEDPFLKARVAEALAATKKGGAEALALLAELEARDLVPDAEAWALLAELRGKGGDAAGRDRALARCRAVAKRAATCAAPGAAPTAEGKPTG